MELVKLIGVLIVIVGFALKLDSILIIFLALITTGIAGGLGIDGLLESIGVNFVDNRSMAIFMVVLLVTGVLERNGLREAASDLIRKIKGATAGKVIVSYGILRSVLGAFNVGLGSVAGFIRPALMPMSEAAVIERVGKVKEEYLEDIKGMSVAMENVTWFFVQNLFIGQSGALLVQGTLDTLGYQVDLAEMAVAEIPIALIAIVVICILTLRQDKRLLHKYYGGIGNVAGTEKE